MDFLSGITIFFVAVRIGVEIQIQTDATRDASSLALSF